MPGTRRPRRAPQAWPRRPPSRPARASAVDPCRLVPRALDDLVRLPGDVVEVGRAHDRLGAGLRSQSPVLLDQRGDRLGQLIEELVDVAHPVAVRGARRGTPSAGSPWARWPGGIPRARVSRPIDRPVGVPSRNGPPSSQQNAAWNTKMITNATSTDRSNIPACGTTLAERPESRLRHIVEEGVGPSQRTRHRRPDAEILEPGHHDADQEQDPGDRERHADEPAERVRRDHRAGRLTAGRRPRAGTQNWL